MEGWKIGKYPTFQQSSFYLASIIYYNPKTIPAMVK